MVSFKHYLLNMMQGKQWTTEQNMSKRMHVSLKNTHSSICSCKAEVPSCMGVSILIHLSIQFSLMNYCTSTLQVVKKELQVVMCFFLMVRNDLYNWSTENKSAILKVKRKALLCV
jgi:hypothetical protein